MASSSIAPADSSHTLEVANNDYGEVRMHVVDEDREGRRPRPATDPLVRQDDILAEEQNRLRHPPHPNPLIQSRIWTWCAARPRLWLTAHYLFVLFNATIVLIVCIPLSLSSSPPPPYYSSKFPIHFALGVSVFTIITFVVAFFLVASRRCERGFYALLRKVVGFGGRVIWRRRTRFWWWHGINIVATVLWGLVGGAFYPDALDCMHRGDTGEGGIVILESYCAEVFTVWSWAIWQLAALLLSDFFIPQMELEETDREAGLKAGQKVGSDMIQV